LTPTKQQHPIPNHATPAGSAKQAFVIRLRQIKTLMSSAVRQITDVERQITMNTNRREKLAFTASNSWQYSTDACQAIGRKYTKIQISRLAQKRTKIASIIDKRQIMLR